jgi:hypothetical protein
MFSGKINYKWPFSIAMLNYQRVNWANDLDDLGVAPFWETSMWINLGISGQIIVTHCDRSLESWELDWGIHHEHALSLQVSGILQLTQNSLEFSPV